MFSTIEYRGNRINITCYSDKDQIEVQLYYKERPCSVRKVASVRASKLAVSKHLKEVYHAL